MKSGSNFRKHIFRPKPFWLLLLFLLAACAFNPQADLQEDLETNIHMFNTRFERKMMDLSAAFVAPEQRPKFLTDSLKVKEKVVFYDSSIMDIKYFNGDQPVKLVGGVPENDFNKAEVTIRYQLAVLPGNQLKTIFVKQIWVKPEERWQVLPDLDVFFE